MSTDEEDQANEELALAEICGHQEFETIDKEFINEFKEKFIYDLSQDFQEVARAGRLKARPELAVSELTVRYSDQEFTVRYLPPIVVEFLLPNNYPSVSPPLFRIQADWLNKTQISKLSQKLNLIWIDISGCVTLFSWLSFLKEETLSFLDISHSLDISEVVQENEDEQNVPVIEPKLDSEESENSSKNICDSLANDQGEAFLGAHGFTPSNNYLIVDATDYFETDQEETRENDNLKILVKDPPSNLADSAQAILHLEEETMRRKRLAKKSLGINSTSDLAQSDALVENRRKTRKKVVKSTNKKFEKSSTVLKCSDEFPAEEDLSKDDKITKVNSRRNTEKNQSSTNCTLAGKKDGISSSVKDSSYPYSTKNNCDPNETNFYLLEEDYFWDERSSKPKRKGNRNKLVEPEHNKEGNNSTPQNGNLQQPHYTPNENLHQKTAESSQHRRKLKKGFSEKRKENLALCNGSSVLNHNSDYSGTIVKWFKERGFGFIQDSKSGEEVYFHISNFVGPTKHLYKDFDVKFKISPPKNSRYSAEAVDVFPTKVNGDVAGAERNVSDMKSNVTNVTSDVAQVKCNVSLVTSNFTQVIGDDTPTKSNVTQADNDVIKVEDNATQVEDNVASDKSDVFQVKSDVTIVKSDVTQVKIDVTQVKSDVNQIKCEITQVENSFAQVESDAATINTIGAFYITEAQTSHADGVIVEDLPKSDEEMATLSIQNPPGNPVIKPNLRTPKLVKILKEFNSEQEIRNFDVSVFACNVCFTERMGSQSIRFPDCHHVYCKDCMAGYFEVQIKEGLVSNLTCPSDKCQSQALPNQVKHLVPESLYTRYESQLLATTLETMSDVLLCPRMKCQCPTLIDRDASMGECPRCHFAFCIYCKAAFHGVAACRIKSQEHRKLVTEYMGASTEHKLSMEKRYSKKQLTTMMNTMLSEIYLTDNTKPCPKCQAPIQKSEGCNKMTCNKCNTHFCYICGSKLPLENPYSHFSLMGSGCFNQLFQGADIDDQEFFFFDGEEEDDELGMGEFVF